MIISGTGVLFVSISKGRRFNITHVCMDTKSSNSSQQTCQGDITHSEHIRYACCTSSMKHYVWLSGRDKQFVCVCEKGNKAPLLWQMEINIYPEIQMLLRFCGKC